MKKSNYLFLLGLLISLTVFTGCDDDEPLPENEEEVITNVILTFSPINGGTDVTGSAIDPDGEGPQDLQVVGTINLAPETSYQLTIELLNSLTNDVISDEVAEEDEEHMFFFGFSPELFLSPDGDGNIDNRDDDINYTDLDSEGNPVGLTTTWTTAAGTATGTFRIVLKHQPGIKSATSTVEDGETDVDLIWDMVVE